ncbi:MAG TPA: GNAT family N-acetyltransferase [Chitinophagaceae bacterium]|nr:GNAT family N-acetyltransferase [Chitinophagaceae bacterium]
MIIYKRTDSRDENFKILVNALDNELADRDGADHSFYALFNKIDTIKHVIVAYENNIAVGCGAIKQFSPDTMEVKRMYVRPDKRGKGIASAVLHQLENWSKELNCTRCILETGKRQPEAIALYTKNEYNIIPNYGQYTGVHNSVCFEKKLIK